MDTSEEIWMSIRGAFAEIAFCAIEVNQQSIRIENTVSEAEMDAFQTKIDRKLTAIKNQIKLIEKTRELNIRLGDE